MKSKFQQSNTSGLSTFFAKHQEALARYIGKKMRHIDDAEDVVQETFIRLIQKEQADNKSIESMTSPQAYIYRTASNLAIDRLRQLRARVDEGERSELSEAIEATTPTPIQIIDAEQRMQQMKRAIAQLPPKCRQVFVLHKFRQMTYREVSSHLGISVSMVEKHMMKALTKLDKYLSGNKLTGEVE
jgi:RNA polymerase sigma factor (sigma-70 family)